jgi:hypothetical protein
MSLQVSLSLAAIEAYRNQGSGKTCGKYRRYYCPIHGSNTQRSLQVNPETGHFKCYSCGAWGYLDENRQEWAENRRLEWLEEKRWRNSRLIVKKPKPRLEYKPQPKARPDLNVILVSLRDALSGSPGEEYLKSRGIPLAVAKNYGVGYAAYGKWPHVKNGRAVRQWHLGRLVFPHTNPDGEVVNLYGRAIENHEKAPKQIKHDHLSGLKGVFNAKALKAETVFICEGVFDALSLIVAGYIQACAIFGVDGLRWEWVQAKRLVFCLDQDDAGRRWHAFAWEGIVRGFEIYWLDPDVYGGYKDLNDVWSATGKLDIGKWKTPSKEIEDSSEQNWRQELETWSEGMREWWEERAGIMEFDGGLSRDEAEYEAFKSVKKNSKLEK